MNGERRALGRRPSARDGFTLMESLAALALMGLIMSILGAVTAHWLPNWRRGLLHAQTSQSIALGLDRIVADLSAAEFVSLSGNASMPFFEGSPSGVAFARSALGPNGASGLELLRIADSADDHALIRARADFRLRADAGQPAYSEAVALIRYPFRVTFAYSGQDRIWSDFWRDADRLPSAVRVTVRNGANEALAVSTTARLHNDAPAECVLIQAKKSCARLFGKPDMAAAEGAK